MIHGEFMVDEKGPILIEVNCRAMGGSLPAAFADLISGQHETDSILDTLLYPQKFMNELKKPYRLFSAVFVSSVVISVFIAIAGILFIRPLASLMCGDPELLPDFTAYLAVLIISGVLIIPLQVLINCFGAFGYPQIGTN